MDKTNTLIWTGLFFRKPDNDGESVENLLQVEKNIGRVENQLIE